jgi:hypothetical protein
VAPDKRAAAIVVAEGREGHGPIAAQGPRTIKPENRLGHRPPAAMHALIAGDAIASPSPLCQGFR